MMSTSVELDQDQVRFYANNGFVVLRNILSPPEIKELQNWAQEVHDLPRTPDVLWMPYEVHELFSSCPHRPLGHEETKMFTLGS